MLDIKFLFHYAFFRVTGGSQYRKKESKTMDHQVFHGTHDEAGYEWGRKLLREGRSLLADVPFPVTKERVRFAEACRPLYEKWYPEVLEEIRGIAAGQQAEQKKLGKYRKHWR